MNGKARHSEKGAELIEMAPVLLLFGNLIAGGLPRDPVQIYRSTPPLIVERHFKTPF